MRKFLLKDADQARTTRPWNSSNGAIAVVLNHRNVAFASESTVGIHHLIPQIHVCSRTDSFNTTKTRNTLSATRHRTQRPSTSHNAAPHISTFPSTRRLLHTLTRLPPTSTISSPTHPQPPHHQPLRPPPHPRTNPHPPPLPLPLHRHNLAHTLPLPLPALLRPRRDHQRLERRLHHHLPTYHIADEVAATISAALHAIEPGSVAATHVPRPQPRQSYGA